jgi:hypothetical protein
MLKIRAKSKGRAGRACVGRCKNARPISRFLKPWLRVGFRFLQEA